MVLQAVEELNELRQKEGQLDTSGDIFFTGPDAQLDSLALINLLVSIEEKIASDLGVTLAILGGDPLPENPSPLKNLNSLIDFLTECVESETRGS